MFMHVIDYSKKQNAEKLNKENFRIYKRLVEIYKGYGKNKKKDDFLERMERLSRQMRENYEFTRMQETERIQAENYKICKRLLEIDYKKLKPDEFGGQKKEESKSKKHSIDTLKKNKL